MGKFEKLFKLNKVFFKLYGLLLYVKRFNLLLRNRQEIKGNVEIKKQKRSNKCFIIGLGPSLKNIDLSKLDGDIIVTNRFNLVENAENFDPVAYVIIDNLFYNREYKKDLLEAIKAFPGTFFVFNGTYKNNLDKKILDKTKHAFIYYWNGFLDGERDNIDLTKVLPIMSNVTCAAEFVALYMGYSEINLLGCDFNSFASLKKNHVYKDDNEDRLWTMSNELFQYSFAADLHCQLDKYSRKHGQRIYNITEGSLIDAYERRSCDRYKK